MAVVQNDLSCQVVDTLQSVPQSTVTGNINPTKVDDESSKSVKNENVKGSAVKPPVQQSNLGAINPLATILSEGSDNVNESSNSQQEQLHFVSSIQRQTETFSNRTSSKTSSIISSSVTISHSLSHRSEAVKAVKSSSITVGMYKES